MIFIGRARCPNEGSGDDIFRMIVSMKLKKMDWEGKIAMVGFGNLPGISDVYPIATVDQHPVRIGAEAYRLLLKKSKIPTLSFRSIWIPNWSICRISP